jgi:hypothetical protein
MLSVFGYSQEFGTAILLKTDEVSGKYEEMVMNQFRESYNKKKPNPTEFYLWTGKNSAKPVPYKKFRDSLHQDVPITKMVHLVTRFKANERVEESFKVDTSGKVTAMFLDLQIEANTTYRVINLTNSEIIKDGKFEMSKKVRAGKDLPMQLPIDMKKYFGSKDPKKCKRANPKEYRKVIAEIKKDKKKTVQSNYTQRAKNLGSAMGNLASILKSQDDSKIWKRVGEPSFNDKGKLQNFHIDATSAENLSKGENLEVYEKRTYGSMDGYERVNTVSVEEATADKTKVKALFIGRKKLKKAMEANAELVFARNYDLIKKDNAKSDQVKRVQIKGNLDPLPALLMKVPNLKLITRDYDTQAGYFTKQYTDEKFIDFNMGKVQGKQEGVDYVFEKTSSGAKATEVATGRIEMLDQQKKKGLLGSMFDFGGGARMKNLCMEILDEGIQVIEVTDQKKGKIKKVHVYCPLGMDLGTLNMYRLIDEQVGGRTVTRKEEIGKAWVKKLRTDNIAEVKIKKGNKELFKALENNEKVLFTIKI